LILGWCDSRPLGADMRSKKSCPAERKSAGQFLSYSLKI